MIRILLAFFKTADGKYPRSKGHFGLILGKRLEYGDRILHETACETYGNRFPSAE